MSPAPVQTSTKPTKNSDSSNSHRSSPQNNPAELVEKPIQKTKEKVSAENIFVFTYLNRSVQIVRPLRQNGICHSGL